jgi:hypothetical protein
MSHYLSQLEGSERAQECIRNDKEMNAHLPDAIRLALLPFMPPPFTEAELLAADLERNADKAAKAHERNDACAAQGDLQWLDTLRRAGL